jgi:hypothetical protein
MATLPKKRFTKIIALILVLLLLVSVGTGILVKKFVTKDLLEQKMEEAINCDVSIGGIEVSLFNFPAKVVITDISLMPKDGPIPDEAPLSIGEISLSIGLLALLERHIDVTHIGIKQAEVSVTYYKDGTTSLGKLFESPDEEKRKRKDDSKKDKGGFNIHDQGDFVTSLGGLSISDSYVEVVLEEMGLDLECKNLNLELSSIKLDPENLAASNEAELKAASEISIHSHSKEHYGDLFMDGSAKVSLFNVSTGGIEPEIDGEFSLSDQSWLSTSMPIIAESWQQLSVLERVGIRVGQLPEKATFGRSKSITAHYHMGRISVLKPLSIWVDDWELALLGDGWLDTQNDQHDVRLELLASKKATAVMAPVITKGIELLPEQIRSSVADDIQAHLFRDDRLLVKVKSSGAFSDPKIRPDGKIIDISKSSRKAAEELLKKKAGSLLEGLLK